MEWNGSACGSGLSTGVVLHSLFSFNHSSTIKVSYPSVCRFPYLCLNVMG